MKRREFLVGAAGGLVAAPGLTPAADTAGSTKLDLKTCESVHAFNGPYEHECLAQIAFPLGGLGAGMICLEGTGALSKISLRHRPNLKSQPRTFSAVSMPDIRIARVLEGPVPDWKLRPQFGPDWSAPREANWGLPRFERVRFEARFPFAHIDLIDPKIPLAVDLTGWSPFSPGDADNSSLPVAGLEYRFRNTSPSPVVAVFSFHTENFLAQPQDPFSQTEPRDRILDLPGGILLSDPGAPGRSWEEAHCAIWVTDPEAHIDHAWCFDGERLWSDIVAGAMPTRPPQAEKAAAGGSIVVPLRLAPGASHSVRLHVAWYVPRSDLFAPTYRKTKGQLERIESSAEHYQPWYSARFAGIAEVYSYWNDRYQTLRDESERFSRTLYETTLPPEVIEAVAANLTILKSPTILRQSDGRLWGWEGCDDESGSWYGSSNHVWNYAQALSHLFPALERSLRETEFGPNQGADGFQAIRTPLPIQATVRSADELAAADGQLGSIVRAYREWRVSGDTGWLRQWWPQIRASLDYCIRTWDPAERGLLEEPHLTTYDVEFWGQETYGSSLYLAALRAAIRMGEALNAHVGHYERLFAAGRHRVERDLFNGEYFLQHTHWLGLRARFPPEWARTSTEAAELIPLLEREGPADQYGSGCLADGAMGAWLAWACGLDDILDSKELESHLKAVHRHNFRMSLADHANRGRAMLACGEDAGLLVCTWPRGGRPTFAFDDADEVWSGIEYQAASHLIALGCIQEGLEVVRGVRRRYDGRVRNPFAEIEAGHWYARAMSSYALLQAFSGARFDAVDRVLYLRPAIAGDFSCFLATASGYGTVGIRGGEPFVNVASGNIPFERIEYEPGPGLHA